MNKTKKSGILNMIFKIGKPCIPVFACAVLFSFLHVFSSFITPQIFGYVIDSVVGDKPSSLPVIIGGYIDSLGGRDFLRGNFYVIALAVLLVALFSWIFNFMRILNTSQYSEGIIKRMRTMVFEHILHLPYEWHVSVQTGDIIQRCTSDIELIHKFFSNQLIDAFRIIVMLGIGLVMMFSMNVKLSLIALAFMPVVIVSSYVFMQKISERFEKADIAEGELTSVVQENLTGARVVRAFGREAFELERFIGKNNFYSELWVKLGNVLSVFWGLGDFITALQVAVIVIFGAIETTINPAFTLGDFIIFVSYNGMLVWPIRGLGRILSELSKAKISLGRIKDIFDAEREVDEPGALTAPVSGDIAFEKVSFSYPNGQKVLEDISFRIKKGSTFAILGGTASGKSTLIHLLNRLYDLPGDWGRITIGGVDVKDIARKHLRKNIGLVLQEPFLYSRSLKENISSFAREIPMSQVRHYAAIAAVDENVMNFSEGYNTVVGERGVTLSGGQRQRVAIARTLLTRAPVMVFDDSFSAVDTETDIKIRTEIKSKIKGVTTIIISQRISTMINADCIMVLDKGKISDMGSHQELVNRPGIYKNIYDLQSGLEAELSKLSKSGEVRP